MLKPDRRRTVSDELRNGMRRTPIAIGHYVEFTTRITDTIETLDRDNVPEDTEDEDRILQAYYHQKNIDEDYEGGN